MFRMVKGVELGKNEWNGSRRMRVVHKSSVMFKYEGPVRATRWMLVLYHANAAHAVERWLRRKALNAVITGMEDGMALLTHELTLASPVAGQSLSPWHTDRERREAAREPLDPGIRVPSQKEHCKKGLLGEVVRPC